MEQIIHVEGMTCQGCATSIEKAISRLPTVESVSANPKTGVVAILKQSPVHPDEIKAVLPPKYALIDKPVSSPSKVKQLFPLGLIFLFLIGGTTVIHYPIFERQAVLPDFMGLFFVVFSFFKLLDLKGFQQSFRRYDPLAKSLPLYGWVYPFVELALGVLFLMRLEVQLALWLTLGILSITTLGVVKVLLSKQQIQCACLGSVLNLPMTEATLIENVVMIGMAGWMLL
jgi:copper chaperone CopZ